MTTTTDATLILGVPVDDLTMEEAVDAIVELVADGRERGVTHQVATINVDFVVNSLRDPQLMSTLQQTSLSVPDGMPIVWGAPLLGGRLRERVAGADLVPALVARAAELGLEVVLYGGAPGVADRAAELLRRAYPGAKVLGDAGPVDADRATELDELGDVINRRPAICCVAFGNPKQERFIQRFGQRLDIPVMIGVGGTLDFVAGTTTRAPAWTHRSGLEWLHRAYSEPRRLVRRYARDARVFIPAFLAQVWRGRPVRGQVVPIEADPGGEITIDLAGVRVVDNRAATRIVTAVRSARRRGHTVRIIGLDTCDLARAAGLRELLAQW